MPTLPKKVLLIFANSAVKKELADPDELQSLLAHASERAGANLEVYTTYARNLSYFVSNQRSVVYDHKNRRVLEEYDLVYFRKAGAVMQQMLSCAMYLQEHNVPFFDREILQASSRNKLSQMFKLQAGGVSIPPTLFCRHKQRLLRLLRTTYKDELSFPLIAKATGGTRGNANYLVHNFEELHQLLQRERRHFLIQQYIPSKGDYRLLVFNGVVKGIIHRQAKGESHLNNTSQGGGAKWLPDSALPMLVRSEAAQAALILGRDIAGVDMILDQATGAHYCLEVNRAPQIEGATFPEKKADALLAAFAKAIDAYVPPSETVHSVGQPKRVIGRFEKVTLPGGHLPLQMVAKVDTGADSSSIHCERVQEVIENDQTVLKYSFEAKGDSWMTAEDYSIIRVRSSSGHEQQRYSIRCTIMMGDATYRLRATLSDRSLMKHQMLLGRRFLRDNKLLVDVARRFVLSRHAPSEEETS